MTPLQALGPSHVRAAMLAYRDALSVHQDVINRLNVYPVPDGDTGTNMALTLQAVASELESSGEKAVMSDVCKGVAHGSLMGARGNSGVILSQLLRGIAEKWGDCGEVGPDGLADALVLASELADRAVVRPVEGTILTVARAAGEGANAARRRELLVVLESARSAAAAALARTPELLPELARAGVVDAGGAGYVLLLDALLTVVDGRPLPPPADDACDGPSLRADLGARVRGTPGGLDAIGSRPSGRKLAELRYEVMYLLHAPDEAIDAFREVWAGLGDSIVVVGGDGMWQCHIHTDDIGAAVEAALDAGRPESIRVTDLAEQIEEERWVREAAVHSHPEAAPAGPVPITDVVAVVTGDGVGRIFRSLGVHSQVLGGQSMNPSIAELLGAVDRLESGSVVVLPNNKNIVPVADRIDGLTAKTVKVVPTRGIVEGFAALLAYDPNATILDNVEAMRTSAARVVSGEVTMAIRNAETDAGPVEVGEWIGLSRDGVVARGPTVVAATCGALERLAAPHHELVTLIEGEGATPGDTRRITEWLHDERPDLTAEVHHGGQPLYPYLFGIE